MRKFDSVNRSGSRRRGARVFRLTGGFMLAMVIALLGLLNVWERVQVIGIGYEIEALKNEKMELAKTNRGLQIETASLASPGRIDEIARKDIGMEPALDSQVVAVKLVHKGTGGKAGSNRRAQKTDAIPDRS